jgi:hypothetical protein
MVYGYISRETSRTVGKTSVTNDAISHIISARNEKQDEHIRLTRSRITCSRKKSGVLFIADLFLDNNKIRI